MQKYLHTLLSFIVVSILGSASYAQNILVDVNLDVKHIVGGISEFDRNKFITVHATMTGNDWEGEDEHLKYLFEELDVYMGRDNGAMPWQYNQADEDPNRPGFVDPAFMADQGKYNRETLYGQRHTSRHKYEDHQDLVIGGQNTPFWPGSTTMPCCGKTGWDIASAATTGDFMGRFLNEFYRDEGQNPALGPKRPKYLEIINEPLYHYVTTSSYDPIDVFNYHNTVADGIREHNQDVKIGGYTAAFPIFEENNFQRWEDRMKLFIDHSGDKMDFFSLHFYDFHLHYNKDIFGYDGPYNYKGGRLEATFDMIEQYSQLQLGEIKPMYISEYGGRNHEIEGTLWTPWRDWIDLKAMNSLMMQFMERPDLLIKTIPFIVTKAEWGRDPDTGVPYGPRLLRQNFEKPGETGTQWVFTELVKLFEFWKGVKGTRVDSKSQNLNLLTDAYIDGNVAYIILNNLGLEKESIDMNLLGVGDNSIEALEVKHLHLVGDSPELDVETADITESLIIDPEASLLLKCTFADQMVIDETSHEAKYYADTYYKPITSGNEEIFNINGVTNGDQGEAVLRIGLGRDHGKSLRPEVKVNGTSVSVPDEYRGDDQHKRDRFFGMIEVPVPYELLKSDNSISITFDDDGGHISSVTLQAFQFSRAIERAVVEEPVLSVAEDFINDIKVFPNPASNKVRVLFPKEVVKARVSLHSISGHTVLMEELDERNSQLDLRGIPTGIYILSGQTAVGPFTKKLNIQ